MPPAHRSGGLADPAICMAGQPRRRAPHAWCVCRSLRGRALHCFVVYCVHACCEQSMVHWNARNSFVLFMLRQPAERFALLCLLSHDAVHADASILAPPTYKWHSGGRETPRVRDLAPRRTVEGGSVIFIILRLANFRPFVAESLLRVFRCWASTAGHFT